MLQCIFSPVWQMEDVELVWKFSQEHHSCQNAFVAKFIECDALVFLIELMQAVWCLNSTLSFAIQ